MKLSYRCRQCAAVFDLPAAEGFNRETTLAYAAETTHHACAQDKTGQADLIGCESDPKPAPAPEQPSKRPQKQTKGTKA